MSTAADRERDTYPPIPGPPNEPPEPVYEYRVVCENSCLSKWYSNREQAERDITRICKGWPRKHAHTIVRRSVGPWEAT
jgi:hypothetical protein